MSTPTITNSERFLNEMVLEKSSFNKLDMFKDKVALAQVIQNILFIEPGTYPNVPTLGVGIENYIFEKFTEKLKSELENNITQQIMKYIPNRYDISVDVEHRNSTNGLKVLFIKFKISSLTENTITEFGIMYGVSDKNNKIVSKLIT